MLAYADVCWRMLAYADVCWRMLTCIAAGTKLTSTKVRIVTQVRQVALSRRVHGVGGADV
jgi:hypothetical protein